MQPFRYTIPECDKRQTDRQTDGQTMIIGRCDLTRWRAGAEECICLFHKTVVPSIQVSIICDVSRTFRFTWSWNYLYSSSNTIRKKMRHVWRREVSRTKLEWSGELGQVEIKRKYTEELTEYSSMPSLSMVGGPFESYTRCQKTQVAQPN